MRPVSIESFISHYDIQRPVRWEQVFLNANPIHVEIGSGLGEFLMRRADADSQGNWIGIERDWKRLNKMLRTIYLTRQACSSTFGANVRVLQVDATVAFERLFSPQTIARIYCLFPCPWPKEGHVKHRLFSQSFLRLLNSRLAEQGEIQIVTDYHPFVNWIEEQLPGTGFREKVRMIKPRFDTKFERKWRGKGQENFFEIHLAKQRHIAVSLKEDVEMRMYFADDFRPDRFQFENVTGDTSIILKDFLYDAHRKKLMVCVVVAEESSTQHVWITIVKGVKGWCVAKAAGHTFLPTAGVAQAIHRVFQAVKNSCAGPVLLQNTSEGTGQ